MGLSFGMQMTEEQLNAAHKRSRNNRAALERSIACYCFYCLKMFNPKEIKKWVDKPEDTAICPYCNVDSIIGSADNDVLGPDAILQMHTHFFNFATNARS